MTSTDEQRQARLAELEARILAATTGEPPETPEEVSELSARAHRAIVSGELGPTPTELRVRLHGNGVKGHLVAADQAGTLLKQTQMLVRWIGSRLRALNEDSATADKDRTGIIEATRLFLQPQFGAGSLVFDLVANSERAMQSQQLSLVDGLPATQSILDRSLHELLNIVASSETDSTEELGQLSTYVSRMGPRVASQLKALAVQVTDDEIDIDLRWSGSDGRRRKANLSRRGALAIKDAVDRNHVKTDEIVLNGLLETASTGKDQVRIDTREDSYRMDVNEELGVTLGRWLHKNVTARVERTVTWHDSGRETRDYKLLSIGDQPTLPDTTHTSRDDEAPFFDL